MGKRVLGEVIAHQLDGCLGKAGPLADKNWSRCTYFVALPGSEAPKAYVLWLQPAEDYEELKAYIEEPIVPIAGLGDAAFGFQDKGDGRYKIYVLKRGDLSCQARGEAEAPARKVAEAAGGLLWERKAR